MVLRSKWGILFTSIGVIIFLVYLVYTNPFSVLLTVDSFNVIIFILAILINYIGLFLLATSWHILLKILNVKISLTKSVQITWVSMFVVWMLPVPSGVEIIRAALVKDEDGSNIVKAASSVIINKVYYYISFGFLILLASFIVMVIRGDVIPVRPEYVWFVIIFALVNTVFFGLIMTPSLMRSLYTKSPKFIQRNLFDRIYSPKIGLGNFLSLIDELENVVKTLAKHPFQNFLSLLMIGFHWSTGALTAYLVALSFGNRISFWIIVLIYAVIEFIQQLNFVIPSGLGIVDAGLTGAFVLVGVPLSLASAISLMTRLATYWFELILCGIVSFRYGYKQALKEYF